jgi:hypothetical protein
VTVPSKPSQSVAPLAESQFPALRSDPAKLLDVIRENLGGEKITDRDLDRVKMPAGGGQMWEVPSLDGVEGAKTIAGVIVAHRVVRAYWPNPEVTGAPPQCTSPNAEDGYGDPGDRLGNEGACLTCAFAQFGSDPREGSNAQACKQMRQIFLLTVDGLLPKAITLAPTSLKAAREYLLRLSSFGVGYWERQTIIGLEVRESNGNKFSVATFKVGEPLDPAEADAVRAYGEALKPVLDAARVTSRDTAAAGIS